MLPKNRFIQVVKDAPLVAVDMIIKNGEGDFLLGKRINAPAKGKWFVPGGRIFKNETIRDAIKRISVEEIGFELAIENSSLKGVYEHIYEDNFVEDPSFNTHYVIIAYLFEVSRFDLLSLSLSQHRQYKYFTINEILSSKDVHQFVKNYFIS